MYVLQRIRLYTTTKDEPDAGTDSGVELWYFVSTARLTTESQPLRVRQGWKKWNLDNPWNDRECGRTDMYELSLEDLSDVGLIIGGVHIPSGVEFQSLDDVRQRPFYLKILGEDWWKIESYVLYGLFKEVPQPLTGINDLGWVEMARLNQYVELSEDVEEGSKWHQILINGSLYIPIQLSPGAIDLQKRIE